MLTVTRSFILRSFNVSYNETQNLINQSFIYVAAKATYIRLLYGQKGGFSALAP